MNYASAFKSAGVRMRPPDMSGIDVKVTGIAAAASHLRDLQHHGRSKTHIWDSASPESSENMTLGDSEMTTQSPPSKFKSTWLNGLDNADLGVPIAPEVDGASQFQATFNQVKADLAVVCWSSSDDETFPSSQVPEHPQSARSEDSRLPSRSEIMQVKIQDLKSRIAAAHAHLDADMRFVRNIATLTPFQKSTRDRLVVALQAVSRRVAQVQLDLTKLTCHHDVLSNDLASESRSWRRANTMALQAAKETLQKRCPDNPPQLKLSSHHEPLRMDCYAAPSTSPYLDTPLSGRPESSLCESFHSAMDFGPAWISAENLASSESFTTPFSDSPKLSSSLSFTHKSATSMTVQSARKSPQTSGESGDHESPDNSEEEAEAWNQTRCAQRVSLVRMPSHIQMPIGREHKTLPDHLLT
jgi:hypothetical protein